MARRLFARALETPGGLKIQTIHSFCQMILGRFPLEANIAGHFELIDDALTAQIIKDARRAVLQKAGSLESGALKQAVRQIAGSLGEHALDTLLDDALKSRARPALADFCRSVAEGGAGRAQLFEFLDVASEDTEDAILSARVAAQERAHCLDAVSGRRRWPHQDSRVRPNLPTGCSRSWRRLTQSSGLTGSRK